MEEMDVKQKVLKEIMDLMDDKEGEGLKAHPKFMSAKLEVEKPESEEVEEPSLEEKHGIMLDPKEAGEEIDPESMQALLDMYKKIK